MVFFVMSIEVLFNRSQSLVCASQGFRYLITTQLGSTIMDVQTCPDKLLSSAKLTLGDLQLLCSASTCYHTQTHSIS